MPALLEQYEAYKAKVERRGQFASRKAFPGNEKRRWHGTKRECHLGEPGHTNLCGSRTCSLCRIIDESFDVRYAGMNTGWTRFGRGVYMTATSSKSNDYSRNTSRSSVKAVLLNKVVVGRARRYLSDKPSLRAPPNGYDSILGEVGWRLNHDEIVVYTNDAVRPSWLVLYDAL